MVTQEQHFALCSQTQLTGRIPRANVCSVCNSWGQNFCSALRCSPAERQLRPMLWGRSKWSVKLVCSSLSLACVTSIHTDAGGLDASVEVMLAACDRLTSKHA